MKNLTLRNIARVCRGIYHGEEKALEIKESRNIK